MSLPAKVRPIKVASPTPDLYHGVPILPHADGRQTYRWRSTSWDLCVPCAGPVYAWLVERLGKPAHDDLGEVMP